MLNRGPEQREGVDGKRPRMADLRASSAIESAADSVWLLHRPEYYHIYFDENGNCLRNLMEVLIEKSSYGDTATFNLSYDKTLRQIKDPLSESAPMSHGASSSDVPF